jgi:hypothetical protein
MVRYFAKMPTLWALNASRTRATIGYVPEMLSAGLLAHKGTGVSVAWRLRRTFGDVIRGQKLCEATGNCLESRWTSFEPAKCRCVLTAKGDPLNFVLWKAQGQ